MNRLICILFVIFFSVESYTQWYVIDSTNESLKSLDFSNSQNGIVGGSDILMKTNDGGNSWVNCSGLTPSFNLFDIVYQNSSTVYLVNGDEHPIWISQDSGKIWENIPDIYVGSIIEGLNVINDTTIYGAGAEYFYKTTDNFDLLLIHPIDIAGVVLSFQFINKDTGYIAAGFDAFLKSIDAGQTWENISTISLNSKQVSFPSADVGYVSDGFDLYRTTDFSNSWSKLTLPSYSYSISHIYFYDPSLGFVTILDMDGNYRLLRTVDSGITWIENDLPSVANDVFELICTDTATCYALTLNESEYYILKTTNSGGVDTTITNIYNVSIENDFFLYPNPASGTINLYSNQQYYIQVKTFDILGHEVPLVFNLQGTADISNLPNGVYISKIISPNKSASIPWVKID